MVKRVCLKDAQFRALKAVAKLLKEGLQLQDVLNIYGHFTLREDEKGARDSGDILLGLFQWGAVHNATG